MASFMIWNYTIQNWIRETRGGNWGRDGNRYDVSGLSTYTGMCAQRRNCQPLKYEDDNVSVLFDDFVFRPYSPTHVLQFPNVSSHSHNVHPSTTNQTTTVSYSRPPSPPFQVLQYVLRVFFPSQSLQINTNSRDKQRMFHSFLFQVDATYPW